MRDVYEVLREKEKAIQRVVREIKVLRLAASLLDDETDSATRLLVTGDPAHGRTGAAEDIRVGVAKKLSARLKRLATPLLNATRFAS